jgi:hypothetical protein
MGVYDVLTPKEKQQRSPTKMDIELASSAHSRVVNDLRINVYSIQNYLAQNKLIRSAEVKGCQIEVRCTK